MRLLRTAKALKGERDYYEYAEAVYLKYPGEGKSVIDEGVAAGTVKLTPGGNFQMMSAQSNGRVAADKADLASAAKAARAAANGRAAAATADSYHRLWRLCLGDRSLQCGADQGWRGRQRGQHPARHGARQGRPQGRGEGDLRQDHRPAHRRWPNIGRSISTRWPDRARRGCGIEEAAARRCRRLLRFLEELVRPDRPGCPARPSRCGSSARS